MFELPKKSVKGRSNQDQTQKSNAQNIQDNFLTQEGNELDFEEHPYLLDIYNNESRYMVLASSRQVGKSTYLALKLMYEALKGGNESIMFLTAGDKQLSEVRDDKIRSQFENNRQLKNRCFGPGSLNNKNKFRLSNQSTIHFKAIGKNVGSARGVTARIIYFDEVQSIPRKNISVVRASARTFKDTAQYVFAGTFLSEDNTLNQLFLDTCQNEWIIRCSACGENNPPLGMQHIDLDRPYLFCVHCMEPMDAKNGTWIPQNPNSVKAGYRICSLMTPECSWRTDSHDGLLDLFESEPRDKFMNEMMGLPSVKGVNLITRTQLMELCGDEPMVDPANVHGNIQQRPSVAAIDWSFDKDDRAASHTIITFAQLEYGFIKVLYAKRFTGPEYSGSNGPDLILDKVCSLVNAFKSNFVFGDYGMGHLENQRLRQRLGPKVIEMLYHGGSKPVHYNSQLMRYEISKTQTLDLVFLYLSQGFFRFPREEEFRPFYEDILNVYTIYDEENRTKKYGKSGNGPDDFAQLLNLCLIGIGKMQPDALPWNRF
ncbi:MAG: phage terminase large subunit family protein [Candidatus Marinimicrobia bacterium]|nr:phage terminase large subunit family protein [Candidatus Neomarinimicrobiota bacterium]